jgi:peroxiredoxin
MKVTKHFMKLFATGLVLLLAFVFQGFTSESMSTLTGAAVSGFSLKNVDGKIVALSDYESGKGVIIVFTCNHCPFAKLYPPRLNALNQKYKSQGVPLIAISSTDPAQYEEDSFDKMQQKAKEEQFNFPYLFDEEQAAAREFEAQKTPHAFVLWRENGKWVIKYSGAIDDNGAKPAAVKEPYVANAVEDLLHGREVKTKETKSIGCKIYLKTGAKE